MKRIILLLIILFFSINFKAQDRIVIKTNKVKDHVKPGTQGRVEKAHEVGFDDKICPKIEGIPTYLTNINLYQIVIDNAQSVYQAYYAKKISYADYLDKLSGWSADTVNCSKKFINTNVSFIQALDSTGKECYMVDINNNNNFNDEEIYYPTKLNTQKVYFEKNKHEKKEIDSTWITFSFNKSDKSLNYNFSEYRTAKFIVDSEEYSIAIRPFYGGLCINYNLWTPDIELYSKIDSQELHKNEAFKLKNDRFEIDSIESDGGSFVLRKIPLNKEIGGFRIGDKPKSFKTITLKGDTINFPDDFKGKYVLLDFWAIECPPCVQEINEHYKKVYGTLGGKNFEIIGVANNTSKELNDFASKNNINWILIPDGKKKEILRLYNIYMYPTLFLIDDTGKIYSNGNFIRGYNFEKMIFSLIK